MSDYKALRTLSKKPSPQESSQEYFEPAKAASARENIEKADRERTHLAYFSKASSDKAVIAKVKMLTMTMLTI